MNATRHWSRLRRIAEREVDALVRRLPGDIRSRLGGVALEILPAVPRPLVSGEGVAPDTLGLFSGPSFREALDSDDWQPPTISLFLGPLWDYAEGDEAAFREEVRTTWLHELGHYLGLEEGDLAARGLE